MNLLSSINIEYAIQLLDTKLKVKKYIRTNLSVYKFINMFFKFIKYSLSKLVKHTTILNLMIKMVSIQG